MQEGENEMPAPTRVSGKAKMARAATQPVKAVTRKAVATSKPLPDIESIKKANPTVDVLEGQAEAGPVAKKSRFEGWEDLDKDDDMDPLMVNEYVVEIFDYMKELEVCVRAPFILTPPVRDQAGSGLYVQPGRAQMEDARHPR
jgi:hypothetical protein